MKINTVYVHLTLQENFSGPAPNRMRCLKLEILRKDEEPQRESTTSTHCLQTIDLLSFRCKTLLLGKPLKLKKIEVHSSKRREKLTSF